LPAHARPKPKAVFVGFFHLPSLIVQRIYLRVASSVKNTITAALVIHNRTETTGRPVAGVTVIWASKTKTSLFYGPRFQRFGAKYRKRDNTMRLLQSPVAFSLSVLALLVRARLLPAATTATTSSFINSPAAAADGGLLLFALLCCSCAQPSCRQGKRGTRVGCLVCGRTVYSCFYPRLSFPPSCCRRSFKDH